MIHPMTKNVDDVGDENMHGKIAQLEMRNVGSVTGRDILLWSAVMVRQCTL